MKLRITTFFSRLTIAVIVIGFTSCQQPMNTSSNIALPAMSAAKQMKMKERAKLMDEKMQQNPCSVEIWEDENYQDDNDVLVGPLESADMKNIPGSSRTDWSDEIDSLKVGPKANVVIWQDPNYNEAFQSYGPGTEKANLRGNPNFSDEISSIRITCP